MTYTIGHSHLRAPFSPHARLRAPPNFVRAASTYTASTCARERPLARHGLFMSSSLRALRATLRVALRSACMPRAAMALYEQLRARAAGRGAEALEMRAFLPPTQVRRAYQVRAQSSCARERAARRSRTATVGTRRGRALRGALHATARRCWSCLATPHACSGVLACCCGAARALRCAARRARKGLVGVRCGSALRATLLAARLQAS